VVRHYVKMVNPNLESDLDRVLTSWIWTLILCFATGLDPSIYLTNITSIHLTQGGFCSSSESLFWTSSSPSPQSFVDFSPHSWFIPDLSPNK